MSAELIAPPARHPVLAPGELVTETLLAGLEPWRPTACGWLTAVRPCRRSRVSAPEGALELSSRRQTAPRRTGRHKLGQGPLGTLRRAWPGGRRSRACERGTCLRTRAPGSSLTASQAWVSAPIPMSSGAPAPPIFVATQPGSTALEKTSRRCRATAAARAATNSLESE